MSLPQDGNVAFNGCNMSLRVFGLPPTLPQYGIMDTFYARLNSLKFATSQTATAACRQLAREYGFTVKQETSANKNVYMYCSREGLSDSQKTGKQTKRKRSSLRCDCKWRIVLFQNEEDRLWEFRKSQNPQSTEHNHELTPPDHIPQPWPPHVVERIAYHASLGLATNEIRIAVQQEFPGILWDERRFYNRLSEERRKIKARETEVRVVETMKLAARVAALVCSSKEYTEKVHDCLNTTFRDICHSLKIDPESFMNLDQTSTSSSESSMHSFSNSTMSNLDILCHYSGGTILVKNIPSQKGRPSKKQQQQQQQQRQQEEKKSKDDALAKSDHMRNVVDHTNFEQSARTGRERLEITAATMDYTARIEGDQKFREAEAAEVQQHTMEMENTGMFQQGTQIQSDDDNSQSSISPESPARVENVAGLKCSEESTNVYRYDSHPKSSTPIKYETSVNDQRNASHSASSNITPPNEVDTYSSQLYLDDFSGMNRFCGSKTSLLASSYEPSGNTISSLPNGSHSNCRTPLDNNVGQPIMLNRSSPMCNQLQWEQPVSQSIPCNNSFIGATMETFERCENRTLVPNGIISRSSSISENIANVRNPENSISSIINQTPTPVSDSIQSNNRKLTSNGSNFLQNEQRELTDGEHIVNSVNSSQNGNQNFASTSLLATGSIANNSPVINGEPQLCTISPHNNMLPNNETSIHGTHSWSGPPLLGGIPSPPSLGDVPPLAGSVAFVSSDTCHCTFTYNGMQSQRMITEPTSTATVTSFTLPAASTSPQNTQYRHYNHVESQPTWFHHGTSH